MKTLPHNSDKVSRSAEVSSDIRESGHEVRDASAKGIVIFAVCLVLALAGVHWISGWVFNTLRHQQDQSRAMTDPVNPEFKSILSDPPEPRLQPEPSHDRTAREDLSEVRTREEAMIGPNNSGWVDSAHQFVRIPIERAIELAVTSGIPQELPSTQPTTQPEDWAPASSAHAPGEKP